MTANINFTWFDLPFLAYTGSLSGIHESWESYAVDVYSTDTPFPSGGSGFSGTWYAADSYDGIVADDNFGYTTGTLGFNLSENALNEEGLGYAGTWYAPQYVEGSVYAVDDFQANTPSAGTVGGAEVGTLHGGYDALVYGTWAGTWRFEETP
jgi:hypothetical protein